MKALTPSSAPVPDRQTPVARTPLMLLLCSHDNMAQLQDFCNLEGQLFTVAQNFIHSTTSLLLMTSMVAILNSNDEDLFSGPLMSLAP